ncbi:hypothetical protein B0T18DRAFT_393354 [Schizothecium vesticola]|uniref:RRM domain-containing protein n=1 Tax=Schizothecium vesticola TaxID=314040 RepID=A0AA40EJM6_9PEZI|nr:hypothetical protein B0T18DRAFT_393354 [Schizothecium vesticola]
MAPELRKRKSKTVLVEEVATTVVPAVKKAAKKTEKRKANEDASPIATKKQKAVKTKKVIVEEVVEEEPIPSPVPKNSALKKEKAGKKGKKAVPEPEPVEEVEEEEQVDDAMPSDNDEAEQQEGDEEELDAKTQALVDAYDSGDENDSDSGAPVSTFKKGQDVGKAPKPKKAAAAAATTKPSGKPGVMYLGSIPHGFYEHEIREYFSQFGAITRLRVVRSKKTGASRHRAFVEFADAEVADIAARTMDSYLLFGHILRARVVDPSQVHPNLFKGANRRFKPVPWNKMAGRHLERPLGETKWAGRISKEEKRRAERAEKLKALGYEWEAPQLKAAEAKEQIEAPVEDEAKAVEAPEPMQVEEAVAEEVVEEVVEAPKTISAGKGKKAKATKKKVRSKA